MTIRNEDLKRNDAETLIRGCFVDLAAEVGTFYVPRTGEPWMEMSQQEAFAEAYPDAVATYERTWLCGRCGTTGDQSEFGVA